MKKGIFFVWDKACQEAFKDIKEYITKSPVLVVLAICKIMDHSLGALLAQKNNEGYEYAIYYLSRTLIRTESRYNPIKNECLALIFVVQKTRHYLVGQTIHVIFRVIPCVSS